jgi:gamma-glutamylcyclotransferase
MLKTGVATDRVYGVLFSIARKDEATLDQKEGYSPVGKTGYDKVTVHRDPDGAQDAIAYIARVTQASVPFHWYKAFVIAGAVEHNLPTP